MKLGLILMALAFAGTMAYGKSPDLILKSANSNNNSMSGDELISVLEGNVVFLYDDAVIKSEYAKWWRSKGTVHFSNHVHVTKQKQSLTCDQLEYVKSKKWLKADGAIDFYDGKERTRLQGQHADYYPDSKFITVTGKPVFINYDTTAHDTLIIHGEKMSYSDSLKLALVERAVTIQKGKLLSRCQTARYYTEGNRAQLRFKPDIMFDHDSLSGDSVDLLFTKKAMRGMSVDGNSHGRYKDVSGKDTLLTDMVGDSLYMAFNDSGKVDSLWAYRNVKSYYRPVKDSLHANEAYGKLMIVAFDKKGDVDNVKVWGNAKSVYHVRESDKGVNIASGDSIAVAFKEGKASHVMLSGSVRGYYAPEKTN
jgi:lipopolysaccharide export system protein LptA